MNKNTFRALSARVLAIGGASLALLPLPALAEEESGGGITLLIPAIAELIPACIAFLIIFIVMSKLVWPAVVKMMEDRENKIQGDIDAAEKAREQAQDNVKSSEAVVEESQRQAADIIAAAKREAENERAAILAAAQKDAAETIARGRDVVETERRRAMEELSKSVVDLSVEIAGKIIGNDLSDDEHRALAEKYLQEVGGSDAD